MPDINFPSSPSLNDTYTYNDITYTWDGEKWTAYSTLVAGSANYSDNQVDIHLNQSNPTDGYVLSWTSGDYAWVAQSGGGGGSYADSDVDTHLNQSSASSGQVLTWNGSDYAWTAKTVDTDTDAQTLSLAGNVITISGSNSNVDLTSALGNVSGGGSGIALTDLSVTTATPSGNGSLTYNNTTGVFTFTPADTSGSGGGGSSQWTTTGSDIYYNTGSVGIGTTNPEEKLEVYGAVTSSYQSSDFASGSYRAFMDIIDASKIVRIGSASGSNTPTGTQGEVSFIVNSSEKMRIDSSGNVGIGVTVPITELHVSGNTSFGPAGQVYAVVEIVPGTAAAGQTTTFRSYNSNKLQLTTHNGGSYNDGIIIDTTGAIEFNGAYTFPTSDGTSGQVLQTNGNGTLSFATVSGGGGSSYGDANVASFLSTNNYSNTDIQPTTITANSTDGTALVLEGGDATGTNSTGGDVNINAGTGALQNGYVNIGSSSSGVYIGANSSTAISLIGTTIVNNQLVIEDGVSEKFSSLTGATGVVTHDCDNGHIFYHSSISADFTANFTNLGLGTNYGTTLTLILDQGATARIPSAVQIGGSAQTINWQGGSAPTGTNNGVDAVSFTILRVSGNYVVLGQLVDFT